MNKPKFLLPHIFLLLLFGVTLSLAISNYFPNSFLTGWDTLHPEFNLLEYTKRVISGTWQSHQGLGALASQSHISEITRIPILWLLDLVLPLSLVRYAYVFLMLALGPLGIYFFSKKLIFKSQSEFVSSLGAFVAGVFYLLNLVTLQHFYVPLEMFLTHYGYLGFLMLFFGLFLENGDRRSLLWFFVVSILMSSQAHTSTLFVALVVNLLAYAGFYFVFSKFSLKTLKNIVIVFAVSFFANAFWLFPNLYFIVTQGRLVQESKIHRLFNEEAYLQNKAYGNLSELALGKGFLFSWGEHVGNLNYGQLLNEWQYHLDYSGANYIGYIFFLLVILGALIALFRANKQAAGVFGFLLASLFFLINENSPTGFIYTFFQNNLPLFKEAFRFHFTKFSITLVFSYSVFFGFVFYFFAEYLSTKLKNFKILIGFMTLIYFVSAVYFMWPAFNGNLISPSMRVKIPERYFEMFEFFNQQDEYGRVADLPIHSFWGWMYYNWDDSTKLGYQGAGFLWFGIKQPLLNREFDRWNITNQKYYQDMTYAVYSMDSQKLVAVLEKYKIRWILVDESIIAPGLDQKILFYENIKKLLGSNSNIRLADDFGDGLYVYEYIPAKDYSKKDLVSFESSLVNDGGYVFRNIINYDESIPHSLIKSNEKTLTFMNSKDLKSNSNNALLKVRLDISDPTKIVVSILDYTKKTLAQSEYPRNLDSKFYVLKAFSNEIIADFTDSSVVEKDLFVTSFASELELYEISTIAQTFDQISSELDVCSNVSSNSAYEISRNGNAFTISNRNSIACLTYKINEFIMEGSYYLLDISGDYTSKPCVFNESLGICENRYINKNQSVFLVPKDTSTNLRFYSRALSSKPISNSFEEIKLSRFNKIGDLALKVDFESSKVLYKGDLVFNKSYEFSGNINSLESYSRYCKDSTPYDYEQNSSLAIGKDSRVYTSVKDEVCDTINFHTSNSKFGYVLEVSSRNIEGTPLRLCLTNELTKKCDVYVELPKNKSMSKDYYFVPPMSNSSGYTLNLSNISFADEESTNEVEYISLTPIHYDFLLGLTDISRKSLLADEFSSILTYSEAYDVGWVAICGFTFCPYEKIQFNGWENGWLVPSDFNTADVKFLYLPSILHWLGGFCTFGVLLAVLATPAKFFDNNAIS